MSSRYKDFADFRSTISVGYGAVTPPEGDYDTDTCRKYWNVIVVICQKAQYSGKAAKSEILNCSWFDKMLPLLSNKEEIEKLLAALVRANLIDETPASENAEATFGLSDKAKYRLERLQNTPLDSIFTAIPA